MSRKMMYSQKWFNLNSYPLDYYELLYQYFPAMGKPIPVTYYHYDIPNSVIDSEVLDGGAYEVMGDLSGNLWKKILLFPIFMTEQVQFSFTADERGFGKFDQITSVFFPTIYEVKPRAHDFLIFDHIEKRGNPFESDSPLFEVNNVEKASTGELTFWKITMKASHFSKQDIEEQLSGTYAFVDYEKRIYRSDDAIFLAQLASKNSKLEADDFFNANSALYLEDI